MGELARILLDSFALEVPAMSALGSLQVASGRVSEADLKCHKPHLDAESKSWAWFGSTFCLKEFIVTWIDR